MRCRKQTICVGLALMMILATGLPTTLLAAADQRGKPCIAIKQACEDAGFKQGAVADGLGLQIDCIRPIIEGAPQRQKAAKPLPTVDAAVVAACKARNPQFGKSKSTDQPEQPTSGSSEF
jgi:hypothetical protein